MISKEQLYQLIEEVAYDIVDNVICPACGIRRGSVWADIFMAYVGDYSWGDEEAEKQIEVNLKKRYGLDEIDVDTIKDEHLSQMALYILTHTDYINSPPTKIPTEDPAILPRSVREMRIKKTDKEDE